VVEVTAVVKNVDVLLQIEIARLWLWSCMKMMLVGSFLPSSFQEGGGVGKRGGCTLALLDREAEPAEPKRLALPLGRPLHLVLVRLLQIKNSMLTYVQVVVVVVVCCALAI